MVISIILLLSFRTNFTKKQTFFVLITSPHTSLIRILWWAVYVSGFTIVRTNESYAYNLVIEIKFGRRVSWIIGFIYLIPINVVPAL